MALRAFAALFLLLSLSWLMPFGVLAEDAFPSEVVVTELEPAMGIVPSEIILEPGVPETLLPPVIEEPVPQPEEAEAAMLMIAPANEEPELVFECEMQQDSNGNPVERCGLGYYRTLCGYNAGVEECVTFFEFYEEPEPPPLLYDIERLRSREYITLHLSWNDAPLPAEEAAIPFGRSGMLGWSYEASLPEHHNLPYTYQSTYAELLAAATLTLQIYEGPIGEASLVYSEEVPHGGSGAIPFTFTDSEEYRIILSATFPPELNVPGYECGGEICPVFEPRIESLSWFMEHAAATYDEIENEIDVANHFIENDVQKTRMSTFEPLVSGMVELRTKEPPQGVSNVLFLPGIKGSRLYDGSGNKLWEPFGNHDIGSLFLDGDGRSVRTDIHTKVGDIVSEVFGNNFYASFVNQMNALKADGTLVDWRPVAYDWRLSLNDIVNNGVMQGDTINYLEQTATPYIEQSLKELAASSPTGKVSIVAHSNGGLVAKKLMQRLEANGEANLVDQIIFVGVPQSGAPQAMAGLLYGYGEALPRDQCAENFFVGWLCALLGSRDVARELAEHSPMAYHLLPSQAYFDRVHDTDHPIAKFTSLTAYLEERDRYGVTIDSAQELYDFLEAKDGGRTKPATSDTANANVLSLDFLNYGRGIHEDIDTWTPPSGITVHQIAGWGMNTIAGVEFYEQKKLFGGYKEMYRPIFVEDGDRVVPIPSALLMNSENAENYWINLPNASFGNALNIDHSNLFELNEIRILIRDLLLKEDSELPELVSRSQPEPNSESRLIFFLHSPLTLELYDEDGKHTGENDAGGFDEEIPDVEYGEFGDVKYIIAPADEYDVLLRGKDTGTFSVDVQEVRGNKVTSSITLADVPTTENTITTITVTDDLSETGPLQVDKDGDGTIDLELAPVENETVIFESELPPITIEENSGNSSRSSRTQRKEVVATNGSGNSAIPALLSHETLQQMFPAIETSSSQEETAVLVLATTEATSELIEETFPERTQTASVYDALGSNFLNWTVTVLYNFWDDLVKIFSSLFLK